MPVLLVNSFGVSAAMSFICGLSTIATLIDPPPEAFELSELLDPPHAGFGWHWWPLDPPGRRATADGSRGQFAYVDRDLDVVVVKTSAWPYDDALADRQYRDLSYLGLPAVARAASRL